jgi:MSHA biogenesis protein MshJ
MASFCVAVWIPMYQQWVESNAQLNQIKSNIKISRIDIETIKKNSKTDANEPYVKEINKYRKKINKQQEKIETITAALISPKNMISVFNALLQNSELEINQITNKEAESINIKGESEVGSLLYKHALSLEMAGTFSGSKKYLARIENQDWNLYWNELKSTTTRYPQGILTLNVHTLSTSDYVFGL